ncbi:DUF4926 domain-containing protein [Crenothrix sp. D3]|jgi:hypothetical protein|nr:DUF4926 domain-containing protein [Crenothrix sp. D3]
MKLLDAVALLETIPNSGLYKGQVGTIVEVYEPDVFEVEFCDIKGQTYALKTLTADKLLLLHHSPVLEQEAA